jgi:hypothetical protein
MVGRYLVVERVVRHGIATAYRALQIPALLDVELAIAGLERDEEVHRNLYRQALALGRLGHHPNLTRLVSFAAEDFGTYLAYESQTEARTLADLFVAHGDKAIEVGAARLFLEPLAAALGALAALGLVHGEVRPENVWVSAPAGHTAFVKLGGFVRIAELEDAASAPHDLVWRAPEQMLHHVTGATTDAYAVAAIAFRLVFGLDPFPGDAPERLFWMKQHADWDPTAALALRVPTRVAAFFRKALAFDVSERFPCERFCGELIEVLTWLEAGGTAAVVEPTQMRPVEQKQWRERREVPAMPTQQVAVIIDTPPPVVKTRRELYEEGEDGEDAAPAHEHSGSTVVMSADELMDAARARATPRMHRKDDPTRR